MASNFECFTYQSCKGSTLDCAAGEPCVLNCGSTAGTTQACMSATLNCATGQDCNVYCHRYHTCKNVTVNGKDSSALYVHSSEGETEMLLDATINCDDTPHCDVTCTPYFNQCSGLTVNAESAGKLIVRCDGDQEDHCNNMNIYCPKQKPMCWLFGPVAMSNNDIYAQMGFNGVEVCGLANTASIGTIHCEIGYGSACVIDTVNPNICSSPTACDDTNATIDMTCTLPVPTPPTTAPVTSAPVTSNPTTNIPTTNTPTTGTPTTTIPSSMPTTAVPITNTPTTGVPTSNPTTAIPTTSNPTSAMPTTSNPTSAMPTTSNPTTSTPTTDIPTTSNPTTTAPTTSVPTTSFPSTSNPTTSMPVTSIPTTANPTYIVTFPATPTTAPSSGGEVGVTEKTTESENNESDEFENESNKSLFSTDLGMIILAVCGVVFVLCIICGAFFYGKRKGRNQEQKQIAIDNKVKMTTISMERVSSLSNPTESNGGFEGNNDDIDIGNTVTDVVTTPGEHANLKKTVVIVPGSTNDSEDSGSNELMYKNDDQAKNVGTLGGPRVPTTPTPGQSDAQVAIINDHNDDGSSSDGDALYKNNPKQKSFNTDGYYS